MANPAPEQSSMRGMGTGGVPYGERRVVPNG